MLNDSPAAWPGYVPSNYDRSFVGPIAAADALAESRNIPALVLLNKLGVERAIGTMNAFGLRGLARSSKDYGLSLAIGGAEATPMELAEAYATLARGGIYRRVSFDAVPIVPRRVLREQPCYQALCAIAGSDRTRSVLPEAAQLKPA